MRRVDLDPVTVDRDWVPRRTDVHEGRTGVHPVRIEEVTRNRVTFEKTGARTTPHSECNDGREFDRATDDRRRNSELRARRVENEH